MDRHPEALAAFPRAVWTETTPEETEEAGDGNMFLLDLETGRLYRPTVEVMTWETQVRTVVGWADNGWLRVALQGRGSKGRSEEYISEGVGELRELPSSGERRRDEISSSGVLAYTDDGEVVLYDLARQEVVAEIPVGEGEVQAWSADGRFLSVVVSESSGPLPTEERQTWIWDMEIMSFIDDVQSDGIYWAGESNQYRYENGGVRLRDPVSREERAIDGPLIDQLWSPGGRYAVISEAGPDNDDGAARFAYRVHDFEAGEDVVKLRGVFFSAWLDEDTLAFTGDACRAHGYYSVDADGSNLTLHMQFERFGIAHPSWQGDRIGYTSWDEETEQRVTTVMDLATGETREYLTGDAVLPAYSGQGSYFWSPDGRYLSLIKPGGRDGICFSQEPQTLEIEAP